MEHLTPSKLAEYKEFYEKNGYLVIPNFMPTSPGSSSDLPSTEELKSRAAQLVGDYFNNADGSNSLIEVFSTVQQSNKTTEYFIQSGDKIRFFFEEDAIDEKGTIKCDKMRAINKIGHALHELDPVFRKFTGHDAIPTLAKGIGMEDPIVIQSMVIFKQPKIGGYVSLHQDSTFINTKPLSCSALWFALEEVTLDNGCLWVIPGSHKYGITRRFVLTNNGQSVDFVPPDPEEAAPWSSLNDEFSKEKVPEKWVPIVCPAGSVVVIHGSVVHYSEKNTSAKSRHVYTFHMVEKNAKYSERNWLQRPESKPFPTFEELKEKSKV